MKICVLTSCSVLSGKYASALYALAENQEVTLIVKAGWDSNEVYKKRSSLRNKFISLSPGILREAEQAYTKAGIKLRSRFKKRPKKNRVIQKSEVSSLALNTENMSDTLKNFHSGLRGCEVCEGGGLRTGLYRCSFSEDLKRKISDKAEIVVLLGFNNLISRDSLRPSKYGILSFHPADTSSYRGRPGSFFEWLNKEKLHGLTLQRLNETIDGGEIICQRFVDFDTDKPFIIAKDNARKKLNKFWAEMIIEGIKRVEANEEFNIPRPVSVSRTEDADAWQNIRKYLIRSLQVRARGFRGPINNG